MEEAVKIKDDLPRINLVPLIFGIGVAVLFLFSSQILQNRTLSLLSLSTLGVIAVFSLPMSVSILFFYFYLFMDGIVKILTNYHPVFHVAQDLIVIGLCLRSVVDRKNGGVTKFFRTPFIPLVFIFLLWIAIQYLNPFGLGILPSIAGTKVYVTGILVFLISYQHFKKEQTENVLTWLVFLGLVEGFLASIEYLFFQGFMFNLHPRYAEIAGDRFVGALFRPFGTTYAPGAPSVWIFLTAGISMYLLLYGQKKMAKIIAGLHLLVSVPTLIFCQTRASLLLSVIGVLAILCCPHKGLIKRMVLVTSAISILFLSVMAMSSMKILPDLNSLKKSGWISEEQSEVLEDRISSLSERKTIIGARSETWGGIGKLAETTVLGIGLSRVGAASAIWSDRINKDENFGKQFSFADNLYRALFTELGLFGLLFWLSLILCPAIFLLRNSFLFQFQKSSALLWLCGTYPFILLIGGLGSEGILYNPCSSFLWIMLALGLKEVQIEPTA